REARRCTRTAEANGRFGSLPCPAHRHRDPAESAKVRTSYMEVRDRNRVRAGQRDAPTAISTGAPEPASAGTFRDQGGQLVDDLKGIQKKFATVATILGLAALAFLAYLMWPGLSPSAQEAQLAKLQDEYNTLDREVKLWES